LKFFVLVFVCSIPFWLLGALVGDITKAIKINLPISSLMLVCPITAALILTYGEDKSKGVKRLLARVFDYKKIKHKIWYLPVILLMPAIMFLSYVAMRLAGVSFPKLQIPFALIPVFFIAFFIGAIGEEVGWSGYAIDALQDRWGALTASIFLGAIWAIWHVIPYIQAHNDISWIVWQCLGTVGSRVIITWIYNNTGKSMFAAISYHAMIDVTWVLFPNYGSNYDPAVTGIIILITTTLITLLWGAKTLGQYRFHNIFSG